MRLAARVERDVDPLSPPTPRPPPLPYVAFGPRSIKRATESSSEADIIGIYDLRAQKRLKSVSVVPRARLSPPFDSGEGLLSSSCPFVLGVEPSGSPGTPPRAVSRTVRLLPCHGTGAIVCLERRGPSASGRLAKLPTGHPCRCFGACVWGEGFPRVTRGRVRSG